MMPKVTILISVHNKVETVGKCLDSLLNLKNKDRLIFVVDGFSTDGSFEVLQKYQDRIELYQVKGSYAKALNWALDKINTQYLALTDADCVVAEDWLDELIKGFDHSDIVSTAGFCGTPSDVSMFQKAIGLELEARFKQFPEYILRAPTMNLCLRTEIARDIKFDEKISVGIETDFGYRLTKVGKMKYVPTAIVWHYHRANLFDYFKQQRNQAAGAVRVYLQHIDRLAGDHISTPKMMVQIPLTLLAIIGLLFGFLQPALLYLSMMFIGIIIIIYTINLIQITKEIKSYPYLILMFMTRTVALIIGLFIGSLKILMELVMLKCRE